MKFLNRFVRKKIGVDQYIDIFDFSQDIGVKALDYGCGIGRLTILIQEFGLDAYGIDISSKAIAQARKLAEHFGYPDLRDNFIEGDGNSIPFPNAYFDITISEAVLDSMHFELAKIIMKEISRVTKKLAFISLISGDNSQRHREYAEEEIVRTEHEKETIQSYFNMQKIRELIGDTDFKMKWCHLITDESLLNRYKYGRYYVVLEK